MVYVCLPLPAPLPRPNSHQLEFDHMNTSQSRREFYTQAAATNLRLIDEAERHSRALQSLIAKLIEATHDLVAALSIEIASERGSDQEGNL
jgi:hypothetical protein